MVVFFCFSVRARVQKLHKAKKKLSYVAVFVSVKEFFYPRVGVAFGFEVVVRHFADVARIDEDVELRIVGSHLP